MGVFSAVFESIAAWAPPKSWRGRSADTYEDHKSKMAAKSQEKSRAARDLYGKVPACKDPARRAKALRSFKSFVEVYDAKATFSLIWSPDHLEFMRVAEEVLADGGAYAVGMPRGQGKSSLMLWLLLYALLKGLVRFAMLIGATGPAAKGQLAKLRKILETNPLLMEDFPEVCFPLRWMGGIPQRKPLYDGKPLEIVISDHALRLPNMPGSVSAGSMVAVAGLAKGNLRGHGFVDDTGATLRPDFVALADPQTRESAFSKSQCKTRSLLIEGDVMGMAAPGVKMRVIMPCTVIRKGDLADEYLDKEAHPDWRKLKRALLMSMPVRMKRDDARPAEPSWEEFEEVRRDGLLEGDGGRAGTRYYKLNRKKLDEGAVSSWPERHDPGQASGVQYAMELFIDRPEAFFAEYQQDPRPFRLTDYVPLDAKFFETRVGGHARGVVPASATKLTAGVDVQGKLLYWVVMAWDSNFTGYVVDYGTEPDQDQKYFTNRKALKTLDKLYPKASPEELVAVGLNSLVGRLLAREFPVDGGDGAVATIDRVLVDRGFETRTVRKFVQDMPRATRAKVYPTKGYGKPLRRWAKGNIRQGEGWRVIPPGQGMPISQCDFDSALWQSFMDKRFRSAPSTPGSFSVFRPEGKGTHELFFEHLSAEMIVGEYTHAETNETRDVWEPRPGQPDNHWRDAVKNAYAGAASEKIELDFKPAAKPARAAAGPRKTKPLRVRELEH